jgi:hypothetical protein
MRGKANHLRWLLCVLFLLGAVRTAAAGRIIYVDASAVEGNDGSSWIDAFSDLQDAITMAQAGDEIRVAQGIYTPTQDPLDRDATFQLKDGVSILGGYAGLIEMNPDFRHAESFTTILSGDLNFDDIEVGDTYELLAEPSRAENSYHVVTGSGTDNTAVLDGFTIISGNANGPKSDDPTDDKYRLMRGGGMYNVSGSPLATNCTFSGNSAVYGGGMANWTGHPSLVNCFFVKNSAARYGGGIDNYESKPDLNYCTFSENSSSWGGGISNRTKSNPKLTNCTFCKSKTSLYGGGMINIDSNISLTKCVFKENEAKLGGGMRSSDSNLFLINCLFVGNIAYCSYGPYSRGLLDGRGGGLYNSNCTLTLTNCTFGGNCAGDCASSICSFESIVTLTNCILWNNSPPNISGDAAVSYSNIQGGWSGEGNMDVDPLFVRIGYLDSNGTPDYAYDDFWVEGDYHLKSRNGRWDPAGESWVIDDVTSPCIDAGDPSSLIAFEPVPNGGRINMGTYSGTIEASMSPSTIVSISDQDLQNLE